VPSIDPTNQLAALIRVQVASLRRKQAGKQAPPAAKTSSSAMGSATPDLAALVAQRVRSISADDPERERKALRIFLETVLLSELGPELVSDPGFATMVDHVQQQMTSDPDLALAAREAARTLLKSADA
jgi:hypothetical protein